MKYGAYHPSTESARVVVIKTCLASIPVYILSFREFLKWAIQLLNSHIRLIAYQMATQRVIVGTTLSTGK